MTRDEQLDGIDPTTYAPYADPRDYITSWTDKIWIARGLGHLREHYAPDVKVHTAYGETYGFDHVMLNSIQRMSAFHNRGGGHDDVVWEQRGRHGFISSHRVLNNATHNGFWTYGAPTGKQWVNRGTAHCLVRGTRDSGGRVVEEWVMRDEFAVLQDLGLDPFAIAGSLAERSPVLGETLTLAGSGAFAGLCDHRGRCGLPGHRPRRHDAECAQVAEMFDHVWNQRLLDEVSTYCAETIAVQSVRLRRAMGISHYQNELIDLLAAFPDGRVEIRDFATHHSADLGLRVAAIWLLRGSYCGVPAYGPVNRAPVAILGSSHFEFRRGKIIREWRMYDEIAVIAQILRGGDAA
jgi:predicted ester cyclase